MDHILRATRLKNELDILRPISIEAKRKILQKLRLDWNYHSNNIEGNSLSFGETKALILHGITADGKPLIDQIEITGHDEAVKMIFEVVNHERELTENFIRELHTIILNKSYRTRAITPNYEPTGKRVHIGEYKKTPNHVKTATGESFRFATPEETPAMMMDLVAWNRKEQSIDTMKSFYK